MGMMGLLALPVLGQSTTSTVIFSVKTASGNPQTRPLSLEAVVDPDDDGSNIFWGWGPNANTVNLTNGVGSVQLEPNSYTVTQAGAPGSFTITVPTNGMIYNAVDLTTNLAGYLSASAGPATVIFPLLTMTGSAQTRLLNLTPIINPVKNGTNIVWGPMLTATPTNGLATTHLEPNGYTVTMNGGRGALTIWVPTDGGSYNGAALPSTMPTSPTVTPTNVIPTGAQFGASGSYGNYEFSIGILASGIRFLLTLGNAQSLEYETILGWTTNIVFGNRIVAPILDAPGFITNDGAFNSTNAIYILIGPTNTSPTGPYMGIPITGSIIGPE